MTGMPMVMEGQGAGFTVMSTGARLLVHAQEVDLRDLHGPAGHKDLGEHSRHEADQLVGAGDADAHMPVWKEARGIAEPIAGTSVNI